MSYIYKKISPEEKKVLEKKYEKAVEIAKMITKELGFLWGVELYRFPKGDLAVLEDNGDACLMKCGFYSEYPEDCIECGLDYQHVLFLLIGDDIVILEVDIRDEKAWIYRIFIPKNLETRKANIKCMANDMMMELLVGQENTRYISYKKNLTYKDVMIFYDRFKECIIYDKEVS